MQNEDNQTPLHVATTYNDAAMIKVMAEHLREKPDAILLKQDSGKRTALHLAAAERDVAATLKVETMLKCLENPGAILMIQDRYRNTPLHRAAERGNTGSLKVMLECLQERAGTAMVMLGWNNRTPLHCAASRGDAAMVKMMLEYLEEEYGEIMTMQDEEPAFDFDPNDGTRRGGKTPLHCAAAENGNEATVVAILDYLAKTSIAVNPMDILAHKKCTPLHLAAREGKVSIIKAMLRYLKKTGGGLCLTLMDNDGMLPLKYPMAHVLAQLSEFRIEMVPK
ncbi:Ankyrin repeat-containing domain protein [Beauveria brongniartii RCEF 3172]|uniref:Ankyrin repeat-containing domain protein n=1 Tax=Beauveria brongniartii RCEF 3172 TaxID=1081107 RepID=A0A167HMC7_9HYPO|nr:Ankyrin repeat-containing domain protein [Beauveria brongniartii RCEF 3172]